MSAEPATFKEPVASPSDYEDLIIEAGGRIIFEAGTAKNAKVRFMGDNLYLTVRGRLHKGTMLDIHSSHAWVEIPEMERGSALYMKAGVLCLNGMSKGTEVLPRVDTEIYRARGKKFNGLISYPDDYDYNFHHVDVNHQQIFIPDATGLPNLQALWDEGRRPDMPETAILPQDWQRPEGLTNY